MQAWKEEFSRSNHNYDVASLAIAFIINLASYTKIDPSFNGWARLRAWVYISITLFNQVLLLYILLRQASSFHRNRGRFVVSNTTLRVFVYYTCIVSCPEIWNTILPLQFGNNFLLIARQLLFIPVMVARANMAHLLPWQNAKYIFATSVPLVLYYNVIRCTTEITTLPAQGIVYKNLVKVAEQKILKWVPLPHFCVLGDAVRAAQLTEIGACVVARNTPVVILGYFVPMVLFYTEEINSRKKFEKEQGLGTGFCHPPSTHFILHALLLPFQTAVTFHTIVYLAWITKQWL